MLEYSKITVCFTYLGAFCQIEPIWVLYSHCAYWLAAGQARVGPSSLCTLWSILFGPGQPSQSVSVSLDQVHQESKGAHCSTS